MAYLNFKDEKIEELARGWEKYDKKKKRTTKERNTKHADKKRTQSPKQTDCKCSVY